MEWISVEERLPENLKEVLVCILSRTVMYGYWSEGEWGVYEYAGCKLNSNVTHWQPLPEGPDIQEKEGEK